MQLKSQSVWKYHLKHDDRVIDIFFILSIFSIYDYSSKNVPRDLPVYYLKGQYYIKHELLMQFDEFFTLPVCLIIAEFLPGYLYIVGQIEGSIYTHWQPVTEHTKLEKSIVLAPGIGGGTGNFSNMPCFQVDI